MSLSPLYLVALLTLILQSVSAASKSSFQPCPLLGARFPIPPVTASSPIIQSRLKNLTRTFDQYILHAGGAKYGSITPNTTSFSVAVFSTEDRNASEPYFYQYHHTAPALRDASSYESVNSDSVYRIGDVTTLITTWLFLQEAGESYWERPVTDFVPELCVGNASNDLIDVTRWDQITLGDLAAHLSGIGRYPPFPSTAVDPLVFGTSESLGPHPTRFKSTGDNYSVADSEYLKGLAVHAPVFGPGNQPILSNAGYILLAGALEKIKGEQFSNLLKAKIFDSLDLVSTTYLVPPSSNHFVKPTNGSLDQAIARTVDGPFNGIYSTAHDMSVILRSILSSATLPQAVTKRWFKPVSLTSNLVNSVGRPWEIYAATASPVSPIVQVYQVRGNVGLYSSHVGLVPDYGVGFVILAMDTEKNADLNAYVDLVSDLIPFLEQNAIEQANEMYTGTFRSLNGTSDTSLIVEKNVDGSPGLSLKSFVHAGIDVRGALARAKGINPDNLDFRLYPTDLLEKEGSGSFRLAFRAVLQDVTAAVDAGTPTCDTWRTADAPQLSDKPLDRFVFRVKDQNALGLGVEALNVSLSKVKDD